MPQPRLEGEYVTVDTGGPSPRELELIQQNQKMANDMEQLRVVLTPLYNALRHIFEILPADAPPLRGHDANREIWEQWKQRLGATAAKIITALQTHKQLNTQQLSMVTGLHRTTIPAGIYKLNKAGLLNKAGGLFSLKEL